MCFITVTINHLKVEFETARSNVAEYKWENQIGEKHNWYVLPILAVLGSQIQISLALFFSLLDTQRFAAVKGELGRKKLYVDKEKTSVW